MGIGLKYYSTVVERLFGTEYRLLYSVCTVHIDSPVHLAVSRRWWVYGHQLGYDQNCVAGGMDTLYNVGVYCTVRLLYSIRWPRIFR